MTWHAMSLPHQKNTANKDTKLVKTAKSSKDVTGYLIKR